MFKNNSPIAILMAAYNAEKYLVEQIDSILEQTNQEWTLFIRNDGSTDDTSSIISEYCNKYENIIEIDRGGENLGCRNNFFRLLEVVESEYYMFCDADDVWFDFKIKISLDRMKSIEESNPGKPILVHTDSAVYDVDLNLVEQSLWKSSNINPDKFLSFNQICICCCIGGSTMLFNDKIKQLVFPLEDNDLIFDYWIAINAVKFGIVSTIHTPTKKYRQHDSNVCGVTVGEENTFKSKIKQARSLFKQYRQESEQLKSIGYGSFSKYLINKLIVIYKIRFSKY